MLFGLITRTPLVFKGMYVARYGRVVAAQTNDARQVRIEVRKGTEFHPVCLELHLIEYQEQMGDR